MAAGQSEARGPGPCGTRSQPARADHDDHRRHGDEDGPGLPRDLRAVPRQSGPVRRRFFPRLVQAVPSRHGAQGPLPRPGRAGRGPAVAGPDPGPGRAGDRRDRHRRIETEDPGLGPDGVRTGADGLGRGLDLSRVRPSRRSQWRPHPPGTAKKLGRQPAGPAGPGAEGAGRHQGGL